MLVQVQDLPLTAVPVTLPCMAERNKRSQALILTVKQMGESNRAVCALTKDLGIVHATLYGGPKSKLKSLVQPFNAGELWIYDDKTRHSCKITDFEVTKTHLSLHSSLYKIWAAELATEIMLKTKCAGDEQRSYILLSAFVDGIDASDENGARLGTIRFLWRYLGMLGVQPDVERCALCNRPLTDGSATYTAETSGFVCTNCEPQGDFSADADGLAYLNAINTCTPGAVRAMTISAESTYAIKRILFHLISQAVGTKLTTIETGMGIL